MTGLARVDAEGLELRILEDVRSGAKATSSSNASRRSPLRAVPGCASDLDLSTAHLRRRSVFDRGRRGVHAEDPSPPPRPTTAAAAARQAIARPRRRLRLPARPARDRWHHDQLHGPAADRPTRLLQPPVAGAGRARGCVPGPGPDPAAGTLQFSAASYAIGEFAGARRRYRHAQRRQPRRRDRDLRHQRRHRDGRRRLHGRSTSACSSPMAMRRRASSRCRSSPTRSSSPTRP